MKKTTVIILTLLIAVTAVNGLALAADNNEQITRITVEGNEHISENKILAEVKTEPGDKFDKDALRNDMQSIMDMGYFQDVRANFKQYNGGLEVVFQVVENPQIKEINIEGNEIYSLNEILSILGVSEGDILNVQSLNKGLKDLQHKYQDDGYIMASFRDVNISEDGGLNISIDIGHLNDIVIKGNEKTKEFVIRREIELKPGQPVNVKDIQKACRNVYQLNYFKNIEPNLEKVETEDNSNQANLVITVEEGETGQLNFGAGYSSQKGWLGYINVKEENLLGRGQNLSFNSEFGQKETTYSLNFYEPWVMGTPTSFGMSLYDQQSTRTSIEGNEYDQNRKGGSISLGHPLTEMWQGNMKYKLEKTEIEYTNEELSDQDSITKTRSITLRADRDTTNHPLNPTDGGVDIFSAEMAGGILGGTNEFVKYNADLRRFYPAFRDGDAWAFRVKTGLGTGEIPLQDQYRLGGSNTLRGYESDIIGNNMLLMQAEYRFPVVDNITGVVFVDSGNAWEEREQMTLDDLNYSGGLGARMNTPLGQIKLDYGWKEDGDGKFHFSIGQTF